MVQSILLFKLKSSLVITLISSMNDTKARNDLISENGELRNQVSDLGTKIANYKAKIAKCEKETAELEQKIKTNLDILRTACSHKWLVCDYDKETNIVTNGCQICSCNKFS